ncbi:MAG: hypothetical protein RL011_1482 [Pseudomonadota bacterium]
MVDQDSIEDGPILPAVAQPTGLKYLFGTWSGRILLINFLVFCVICGLSDSIFSPDMETLLRLGAKDPVKLAEGQYWRLITPMFLHVGIVHFGFNSYFLYIVGYQIERLIGASWFVLVYLLSGVGGNLASAAFSVNMSAGASSALFGLLGAGFLLERTVGSRIKQLTGRRPRNRAYAMTLLINLGLGLLIPFIDNSAHIGGLVTGCLLTAAMINLRPNNLHKVNRSVGCLLILTFAALVSIGAYMATNTNLVHHRLTSAASAALDEVEKIFRYSQAIALEPWDWESRLKRARLYINQGAMNYAFNDLRAVISLGEHQDALKAFIDELDQSGHIDQAWEIRQMLSHSNAN